MHPRFDLPWVQPYGLTVTVALCCGWWVARRRAVRDGLEPSHVDLLVPLAIVGAALGSRLLGVLDPADAELAGPQLAAPGRSRVFGLLLGGIVTVLVYARVQRLPFGRLADVLAIPAALFLAIVRVGCLLAGCCWGDVSVPLHTSVPGDGREIRQVQTVTWLSGAWVPGIRFPAGSFAHAQQVALGLVPPDSASLPVHPVQLYEAVLLLTLVWVVRRNEKQWRGSPGRTASATVIGYTVLRFFTEFLRADNRLVLSALTMPQVLSLLAGATVAAVLCAGGARQTRLLTECPADSKR